MLHRVCPPASAQSRSRTEPWSWPCWAHCCVARTDFPWSLDDEDGFLSVLHACYSLPIRLVCLQKEAVKISLVSAELMHRQMFKHRCASDNQVWRWKTSVRAVKLKTLVSLFRYTEQQFFLCALEWRWHLWLLDLVFLATQRNRFPLSFLLKCTQSSLFWSPNISLPYLPITQKQTRI